MRTRMYPVSREFFNSQINPLIISYYSNAGRPQKVDNYQIFCAMLYVLSTGIPWRDLPRCYGGCALKKAVTEVYI